LAQALITKVALLQGKKVKITVTQRTKIKSVITQYWVVLSTSYLGVNIRITPPTNC